MIRPNKEVNRTPGLAVHSTAGVADTVVGGIAVRLDPTNVLFVADGSLPASSCSLYGVAADTNVQHSAGTSYTIQDDFAKGGLVGCYINGGQFEVWNDGRGAVFATDVINAPIGSLLYIDSSGRWTITAGSAGTAGATSYGIVVSAPTSATGALKFQFNM